MYQVDLTTGLQQWYPATGRPTGLWLWYQVHTGTWLPSEAEDWLILILGLA